MAHNQIDFSIIHENGKVSIVRNKTAAQERASVESKSMRVQCFDSNQVDRIFHYQEILSERNKQCKESSIRKLFKF